MSLESEMPRFPFAEAAFGTAIHNILLYRDLERVLAALANVGVAVIVLKGAALAETVYDSIADRPMTDVDLLVHAEDCIAARIALESIGYRLITEPKRLFSPFDNEFTGEMVFVRDGAMPIELHWQLTVIEWTRRLSCIEVQAMWDEATPLVTAGVRTLQLSPRDTLVHICLHLATHGYAHGVAYNDIRQLVTHYQPFPWSDFIERARSFRLAVACFIALREAARLAAASVPADVFDALRPGVARQGLVDLMLAIRRNPSTGVPTPSKHNYLVQLTLADRPADLLGMMMWLLFPGPRWLAERYRLSGALRPWLACFWHPLVVLGQGVGALWDLFR